MNIIRPNDLYTDLFKDKSERQGNYFGRVLGIKEEQGYNNMMAFLNNRFNSLVKMNKGLIFVETIPNPYDKELIDAIMEELNTMNINNLKDEDINLVENEDVNNRIKEALSIIVPMAIANERFSNVTIRNNFIVKIMIWINKYVEEIDWSGEVIPKCLYYGPIKKHEAYFIMALAVIGFDVIYLNPLGDDTFKTIDTREISYLNSNSSKGKLLTFKERAEAGIYVEKVTTYAKQASKELDETLYNGTGVYRPWQYADGYTVPIIMNSIIEDMLTYWDEPARLRPGFKTEEKMVYVPTFFNKISGVYADIEEYYEMISKLKAPKNTVFLQGTKIASREFTNQQLYSLAFMLDSKGFVDKNAVKACEEYKRLLTLRSELQDFILDKINEVIRLNGFLNFKVDEKMTIRLLMSVMLLDENMLNLIDSYDFTGNVPKIIIFINGRELFEEEDAMLLALLHVIGMDIVILTPGGSNNIELQVSEQFINIIRLEEISFDFKLRETEKQKKKSFFGKIFER